MLSWRVGGRSSSAESCTGQRALDTYPVKRLASSARRLIQAASTEASDGRFLTCDATSSYFIEAPFV